uniref:Uncharacterized protein n=1 Tax=uncultured marine virus TaxID=186617 RepID=A0A0F7L2Q7_9VIRU|nr:hypothetical protein [uncultured marine virus]
MAVNEVPPSVALQIKALELNDVFGSSYAAVNAIFSFQLKLNNYPSCPRRHYFYVFPLVYGLC